jgi:hypothetical protein
MQTFEVVAIEKFLGTYIAFISFPVLVNRSNMALQLASGGEVTWTLAALEWSFP